MNRQLQYSVQVAGRRMETYVAAFNQYNEALKWAEALAVRIHEEGSQQMVNIWDERENLRVHAIYAPLAVAA